MAAAHRATRFTQAATEGNRVIRIASILIVVVLAGVDAAAAELIRVTPDAQRWPKAATHARNAVVELLGDLTHLGPLTPAEPAIYVGKDAKLASMTLYPSCNGTSIQDVEFTGLVDVRASDCVIKRCRWNDAQYGAVRIRFGAHRNTLDELWIERTLPLRTTADIVGIYFSDGPNKHNTIKDCTILNMTDAVQCGIRHQGPDGYCDQYGHAAGTRIIGNRLGFTRIVREGDKLIEGMENCIDLKTAGSESEPLIIERNVLFGTRPNKRTLGYAINHKDCVDHLVIRNNTFADCSIAIFKNIQYRNRLQSMGVYKPVVKVWDNLLIETPVMFTGLGEVDERGTLRP
jgi:hypothetical protein